jgi:hypothetical protein
LFNKRLQKRKSRQETRVEEESEEENNDGEENEEASDEENEENAPKRLTVRLSRVRSFHLHIFYLLNVYSLTPTLLPRLTKNLIPQTPSL